MTNRPDFYSSAAKVATALMMDVSDYWMISQLCAVWRVYKYMKMQIHSELQTGVKLIRNEIYLLAEPSPRNNESKTGRESRHRIKSIWMRFEVAY
jgi:hypothetical protein